MIQTDFEFPDGGTCYLETEDREVRRSFPASAARQPVQKSALIAFGTAPVKSIVVHFMATDAVYAKASFHVRRLTVAEISGAQRDLRDHICHCRVRRLTTYSALFMSTAKPAAFNSLASSKRQAPFSIQFLVKNARVVGRNLDSWPVESAYAITTEASNEVAQFENHVLPGTRFLLVLVRDTRSPSIVRGKQYDCESHVGVVLELLDNRPPPVRLLSKNDDLLFDASRNGLSHEMPAHRVRGRGRHGAHP